MQPSNSQQARKQASKHFPLNPHPPSLQVPRKKSQSVQSCAHHMEGAYREEEALATRPLLQHGESNASSSSSRASSDSSVTFSLVLSTFIAVCGSFCYGCSVGYSSAARSGIVEDLNLSVAAYSVFGSIMTIGGIVGAIFSGKLSDRIGRKKTMWLSQIFCTPGWLIISFAKDAQWLCVGRLSIGFGVGLITYVVPVYIAEISSKNVRGRFATANLLLTNSGFALVYFLGNIVSWRSLAFVVAVPCLVQIGGLFMVPESPRWLAKCGRQEECEASLQRLRGKKFDVSEEVADINETIQIFQDKPNTLDLFQKRYAYPIVASVGLMLLQQLGGVSGVSYYVSSVFSEANFSTKVGTTALSIIQIPAAILSVLLMDKFGRRPLLMVSSSGTCLCMLLVGLSFFFQELGLLKELTPILVFIALLAKVVTFAIGMSEIPWILMSEIFPLNIKASAGSLVTLTNWTCSWIVTYTFNFMMEWNPAGTFLIYSCIGAFTVVFIWKLVPETKGRTLEEIQAKVVSFPNEYIC